MVDNVLYDEKIVFIIDGSSRIEEKCDLECYGASGTDLDGILKKLNNFDSKNKSDYRVINLNTLDYLNSNNLQEVEPNDDKYNKGKIYNVLKDREYVICFGESAIHIVDSIIRIYEDINLNVITSKPNLKENDKKKEDIFKLSKRIINCLEKEQEEPKISHSTNLFKITQIKITNIIIMCVLAILTIFPFLKIYHESANLPAYDADGNFILTKEHYYYSCFQNLGGIDDLKAITIIVVLELAIISSIVVLYMDMKKKIRYKNILLIFTCVLFVSIMIIASFFKRVY